MKNNNDIHHAPYLRNSIAYDYDFWYNFVKWWYLQVSFSFFSIFYFSGCLGKGGVKRAKNCPQWQKHSVCWTSYLRNHTSWSWLMVHMCNRIIPPGIFLHFLQILIFRVSSGAKEQKMAWNEKKLCLCKHSIAE